MNVHKYQKIKLIAQHKINMEAFKNPSIIKNWTKLLKIKQAFPDLRLSLNKQETGKSP